MIEFFSGTPGSGKSYHAVKRMIQKLKRTTHNNVISNIPLDFSGLRGIHGKFFYVENDDLNVNYLKKFAIENHDFSGNVKSVEGQTLVVIDECQIFFNPREHQKKDRLPWVNFFTMHRHLGFNFILISQFDKLVDRQIRNNFEYNVIHKKCNNFKWLCLLPVPVFLSIEKWYGCNERMGTEFIVFNKKYGNLYASCRNILLDTPSDERNATDAIGTP